MSSSSKGTYYKNKTREYFRKRGYHVVLTEFTTALPIRGRTIWIKKDLLGSDGIAMSKEKNEFILWNSKGVATADSKSSSKYAGRKEFEKFPFPDCVKRQLVIWEHRVKEPLIVDC